MTPIDMTGAALFIVGVGAFLTVFLPFSPMTIDIVNLSRDTQLSIFHQRKKISIVGAVCLFSALILGGVIGELFWVWLVCITTAVLGFMFWSGYVPWVMTAPDDQQIISIEQADELIDDDAAVLGLHHNGEARAYPRDLIARPHFMTDTVGGAEMTISYCILCNSGLAFVSEIDGRPLELDCVTAYNNNIIYRDKRSGNIIQQLDAEVIEGPNKGLNLESLPLRVMTWGQWKALHPMTKVCYAPAKTLRDKMVALMLAVLIPIAKLSKRSKPWHRVQGDIDKRLPAMSTVFGVEISGERLAFPEAFLKSHPVHNEDLGGQAIATFYDPNQEHGGIYYRAVDGRTLEFVEYTDGDGVSGIRDQQTESTWNFAGMATQGELAGTTLRPVPHFNKVFWFSWSLFKPGTAVAES